MFHNVGCKFFQGGHHLPGWQEAAILSFHCMQNQKREVHVFLKEFCLPAGVILSVADSSCIVKVGSSWVGDVWVTGLMVAYRKQQKTDGIRCETWIMWSADICVVQAICWLSRCKQSWFRTSQRQIKNSALRILQLSACCQPCLLLLLGLPIRPGAFSEIRRCEELLLAASCPLLSRSCTARWAAGWAGALPCQLPQLAVPRHPSSPTCSPPTLNCG